MNHYAIKPLQWDCLIKDRSYKAVTPFGVFKIYRSVPTTRYWEVYFEAALTDRMELGRSIGLENAKEACQHEWENKLGECLKRVR